MTGAFIVPQRFSKAERFAPSDARRTLEFADFSVSTELVVVATSSFFVGVGLGSRSRTEGVDSRLGRWILHR